MNQERKTRSGRILALDSMRGLAALSVALFHYTYGFNHGDTNYVFHKGFLGVQFFFILSGFVIFMTVNKKPNLRSFVVGRFTRLYPAYWLSVVLTFLVFKFTIFRKHQFLDLKILDLRWSEFFLNRN